MCETFGQDPSRSVFKWFLLIMNCSTMFFHVIHDLKIECLRYCWNFGSQNSLMLCLCGTLLAKIRDVQFLSFIFNFASRNSKRRLKIESLRYCSNFGYQNSLMLCWCGTLLAKIRGVQFLKGFISSWTAATCSFMLFLIENWISFDYTKRLLDRSSNTI